MEDLNSYNDTLLEEKGQLNGVIGGLKSELRDNEQLIKDYTSQLDKANTQLGIAWSQMSAKSTPTSAQLESYNKQLRDMVITAVCIPLCMK